MRGCQENWTDVRYRRKIGKAVDFHGAISYYVAGMTTGVKKAEIRNCFDTFGDLVDVYMGKKKDASGKNFAFVKFRNVKDIWKLESDMQNTICAGKPVSVNVARYGRNKAPIIAPKNATSKPSGTTSHRQTLKPPQTFRYDATKTRGSYAAVTTGSHTPQAAPLPTPITLNPCNSAKNWLTDNVLVGEALSIDHLASLHAGLHGDVTLENIKYLGGLKVGLCFKDLSNASNFMADTSRWIEWLHWVVPGNSKDFCDERIAWINIIGLPMRFWSDENINAILRNFGKIIVPSDEMGSKVDESIMQLGILTKSRRCINTEVAVTVELNHFNVGVVEFERNWTPFSENTFMASDSSSDDEGNEDDDGISDTDMALEEGEIPAESGSIQADCGSNGGNEIDSWRNGVNVELTGGNEIYADVELNGGNQIYADDVEIVGDLGDNEEIVDDVQIAGELADDVQIAGEIGIQNEKDESRDLPASVAFPNSMKPATPTPNINDEESAHGPPPNTSRADQIQGNYAGPENQIPLLGHSSSFYDLGLFPSTLPPLPSTPPPQPITSNIDGPQKLSGTWNKRRKISKGNHIFFPYHTSTLKHQPEDNRSNIHYQSSSSLDLNRDPTIADSQSSSDDPCSSSAEIDKTVAVGIEVGFQLSNDSPLLAQIVGGNGEITGRK